MTQDILLALFLLCCPAHAALLASGPWCLHHWPHPQGILFPVVIHFLCASWRHTRLWNAQSQHTPGPVPGSKKIVGERQAKTSLILGLSLNWWDEIHPLKWFPDTWANYSVSQKNFVNTTALLALNCQAQSADHHHPCPRHLLTCCMCECVRVWVTSSFTQLSLFKTECEQYD